MIGTTGFKLPAAPALSIQALLREASCGLGASASPRLDAELLLCHALGILRTELYIRPEWWLSGEQQARFCDLLRRRRLGVPVAYLTQHKEFWSLDLEVNPAVLIPRPETEHLVEAALEIIAQTGACDLADLGTGSGAIALAIADEKPQCRVLATDICPRALALAKRNRYRLGLPNVELRQGDWCDALKPQRYDLIVCNPPYVAKYDPCLYQSETCFEPRLALCGGEHGLDGIAGIVARVSRYLRSGGYLLLEHGHDQQQAVRELSAANGLWVMGSRRDHQGHDRVLIAMAPPCAA